MSSVMPIRFGAVFLGAGHEFGGSQKRPEEAFLDLAQDVEKMGYSTFAINDHISNRFAALIALTAVANATSSIRLSQAVLNQDFRHPAILANELATLDRISKGRVEVGIGAGWMRAEYEQVGIPYEKASARIERLEEQIVVLKGLFAEGPLDFSGQFFTIKGLDGLPKPMQSGGPPIKVGGGGPKILAAAGRRADIVEIMGGPMTADGKILVDLASTTGSAFEEKISWVRNAAGDRFDDIELSVQLGTFEITDDAERAVAKHVEQIKESVAQLGGTVLTEGMSVEKFLASPSVAIGTVDEICQKLLKVRDDFGFSYFIPASAPPVELAPVIERIAGK